MTGISVGTTGTLRVKRLLGRVPEACYESAKKGIAVATFGAHAQITANVSGRRLQRRTGALARSFQPRVEGQTLSTLRGEVFSISQYAPPHEYGATIEAKKAYKRVPGGPYLNIPTAFNKTPAGVQRLSAKSVFQQGGHIAKTKRGKFVVMLNGVTMFSLVKKVKIPAKLGMREAQRDQIPALLTALSDSWRENLLK